MYKYHMRNFKLLIFVSKTSELEGYVDNENTPCFKTKQNVHTMPYQSYILNIFIYLLAFDNWLKDNV